MQKIDGYQIFAELKRGAASTIYKAWDFQYSRTVLIKLLPAEVAAEPQWRAQFLREGKISARLAHPNLRRILQSGLLDDEPFLVLEYVEGPTLFELIRQHKQLPIDICLFIAKELAKGIMAVHQHKVLHRDIKPQNVFLSLAGAVKLGDLGLAHDRHEATTSIAGTPAYMSPEQVLGREITEASDLFSFGAVFYETLTGEPAFADRTLAATLHHVVNWDPVPITLLRPDVPTEVVSACQRLLAKNPAERFRDAEAVVDHLQRLERRYGVSTTGKNLAEFFEAPQAYRRVQLQQNISSANSFAETKRSRTLSLSWGVAAVAGAVMFFAGVLYIWGIKTYMQRKAEHRAVSSVLMPPPNAMMLGYLDLHVKPPSVIHVNGDSLGATPLMAPIALPPGSHELRIYHPQWGERKMRVNIIAGETLRHEIDLTKP
ncbi:MAG: protein kinase [candidate division KSB1 bacterium]|nr:protein kinase [candidate division KSB1 bacterium]MDZ7365470.1 protein kinase [candidate division KSB1 bacterium]MDZ7403483.1 protein kinase [candidate division KSB1 bacterium]